MKRLFVTTSIGAVGLCTLLLVPLQGCTDLTETPISSVTPSQFFHTEGEVLSALAGVYAGLRNTVSEAEYWGVSEVSSDEIVVPTRGSDWFDNGTWLETHRQTWSANSPATLSFLNNAWNTSYAGIARANVLLDALTKVTVPKQARIEAEIRFLRGFYYYLLMDLFGGVPIATSIELKARARATRDSTFNFIESELLAIRTDLPPTWDASNRGRVTRGAADALLANMYLNARVFKHESADAGIDALAYNTCLGVMVSGGTDACQAAIDAADRVLTLKDSANKIVYQLADTFVQNFNAENQVSPENIFVIKFADADGLGFNMVMRTLHYNQFTPSPWNGFAALAQTYNAFAVGDKRRDVLLQGPQVNVETGLPTETRDHQPLNFSVTIANVTQASEGEGTRIYKWPIDKKHVQQFNGNDYAWLRLAEVYLIKAEALNELGRPGALDTLNAVRARTVAVAPPLAGPITQDMILRERLFEFLAEGKRRQDLIRHGKYTACWEFKTAVEGTCPRPSSRVLMPIPQTQVDANPMIHQNPGY